MRVYVCVCVCVEGKGEGDVGRRMCTSLCNLHFPQGYMKGSMTVGESWWEFWTPLSKTDLPSWVHDGEEGGGGRKERAEKLIVLG